MCPGCSNLHAGHGGSLMISFVLLSGGVEHIMALSMPGKHWFSAKVTQNLTFGVQAAIALARGVCMP